MDFSSWQGVLATVLGLAVITLVMVGIRLLVMQTVQQRNQRENRQVNERLRLLIAAYKVLGGSFTGDLLVDPTHLRDLRQDADAADSAVDNGASVALTGSDRRRRVRDAVEAALSDVILLGTEEQVRLAAQAASDLAAGRTVETAALVVSLRDFVRQVLDLEPVPSDLTIPKQGALRPPGGGSSGRGREARADATGGKTGAGAAGAGGLGMGVGLGGTGEADR